jgi:hypothetical protein
MTCLTQASARRLGQTPFISKSFHFKAETIPAGLISLKKLLKVQLYAGLFSCTWELRDEEIAVLKKNERVRIAHSLVFLCL